MTWVAVHPAPNPSMRLTKTCESENSHGRKDVINRKSLLNELASLRVHTNEAQHTKARERLSNGWYCLRDWVRYF